MASSDDLEGIDVIHGLVTHPETTAFEDYRQLLPRQHPKILPEIRQSPDLCMMLATNAVLSRHKSKRDLQQCIAWGTWLIKLARYSVLLCLVKTDR